MNYSQIRKYDVSNGKKIRSSIFFCGCPHHCPHCFNKSLWDFNSGQLFDDEAKHLLFEYLSDEHVGGLSVLGGEPLVQGEELVLLLQEVRERFPNKDIWLWTGYYIDGREELTDIQKQILDLCDVIVDGRFINELKDITLKFRGSSNQTIYERDPITRGLKKSELND